MLCYGNFARQHLEVMKPSEIFYCVNDAYWLCSEFVGDFMEEHAPLNRKFIRGKQAPYMNSKLRKATKF